MKMLSTIALFATLMWCAAAAPMGGPQNPAAKGDGAGAGMPRPGGPGAGIMMGPMHMPFNISSECRAAINTTCSACPAPPTGAPMQPPSADGVRRGGRGPAAGNGTIDTCVTCVQTNSDALIAAGCDHLKCPAAMAATCPDCPRPGASNSCQAPCAANRSSTECSACRGKCRACIDENTDALIAAGCKDLACSKLVNTTCPVCVPSDTCRAACDVDRSSSECTQCGSKRTACADCLAANNATMTDAGCPLPKGPMGSNFPVGGGMMGPGGKSGMGGDRGRPTKGKEGQ